MRVREELYMTTNAYETLYESSLTFSMRKQLQAEQGTPELNLAITELEDKKAHLEERAEEMKKKKEALEKQFKDRKLAEDKKRAEEIDFLKYQANHLQNFLRSVNEANKWLTRGFVCAPMASFSRVNFCVNGLQQVQPFVFEDELGSQASVEMTLERFSPEYQYIYAGYKFSGISWL